MSINAGGIGIARRRRVWEQDVDVDSGELGGERGGARSHRHLATLQDITASGEGAARVCEVVSRYWAGPARIDWLVLNAAVEMHGVWWESRPRAGPRPRHHDHVPHCLVG